MPPSQLERRLRRLQFRLDAARNARAWSRSDLERGAADREVAAAREALLDAWAERQDLVRAWLYAAAGETVLRYYGSRLSAEIALHSEEGADDQVEACGR